jgi:hypothetical protein
MTPEEFRRLDLESKRVLLFEANKIAEREDDNTKYELFSVNNLFIETKTSRQFTFKRTLATYTLNELPSVYAANLQHS